MTLTYWFLLAMTFTGCQCNSSWKIFHKEPWFTDRMCPPEHVEFKTVAKNALWCLQECAEKSACRSLIYLQSNNSCFGVKSDNPFSWYSSLPGTVFYRVNNIHSTISSTTLSAATSAATTQPTTSTIIKATSIATTTIYAPSSAIETTTPPTATKTPSTTMTISMSTPSKATSNTPSTSSKPPSTTHLTSEFFATMPDPTTLKLLTGPGAAAVAGLQDNQFTASSIYPNFDAWEAKLNNAVLSWVPASSNQGQWIKIDFGETILATHVITKRDPDYLYWVTSYKVSTSTDCTTYDFMTDEHENEKIYDCNTDRDSAVENTIEPPVVCRCFMIYPWTYSGAMGLRFDVLVHTISQGFPGVAALPDSQLTASSSFGTGYEAWQARIDNNAACWRRADQNISNWIQVDFMNQTLATHIVTKGNSNNASWVTSYKVFTSTDCKNWHVQNSNGTDKVFDGNIDGIKAVQNALDPPVIGRCFRISPQSAIAKGDLRLEVLMHEI